MNNSRITVTTTSTLQGWEVQHYLKPVSVHLVAGTNLFSDVFASFSDVFGGRSNTYQKQIANLYNDAIEQLKTSATVLGANCILGLSVDLDEISGKGKSMFMITATGTAAIAERMSGFERLNIPSVVPESISADQLTAFRKKRKILQQMQSNTFNFSDTGDWQFILENRMFEAYDFLLKRWRLVATLPSENEPIKQKILELFENLPNEKRYDMVYGTVLNDESYDVVKLMTFFVKRFYLVDFDTIESILKGEDFEKKKRILRVVVYDKEYYDRQDLAKLKGLISMIENGFPEVGERTSKKQFLSSKEKEVWKCDCGKYNQVGEICSGCDKDIFGFRSAELKPAEAIRFLREKAELIEEQFKSNENQNQLNAT